MNVHKVVKQSKAVSVAQQLARLVVKQDAVANRWIVPIHIDDEPYAITVSKL